jgi:putative Ca2+/H+ antiporter (TMEM165/GDT1 family)
MEAFFISTGLVALAETGDKTQLLSLLLTARYRQPLPIVLGIAVATLANHALAGLLGGLLARHVPPDALRWCIGLGFLAMALWTLKPDRLDDNAVATGNGLGVFAMTTLAFFLAEMGDKTQLATIALAARFEAGLVAVVAGTTVGMLMANVPVVYAGRWLMQRLPLRWIRVGAAIAFAVLGILVLLARFADPA